MNIEDVIKKILDPERDKRHFVFCPHDINHKHTNQIADAIKRATVPVKLSMSHHNNIEDEDEEELGAHDIGDAITEDLSDAVRHTKLALTLDLGFNAITYKGAQNLADAITEATASLTLYLGHNFIGDEGAKALAKALARANTPISLHLSNNFIGDEGAKALAEAVKVAKFPITMNLSWNNIGPTGIIAIAGALERTKTLVKLNLTGNTFGPKAAKILANSIKSAKVPIQIDYSFCNAGQDGAKALIEAAAENEKTLNTLAHKFLVKKYLDLKTMQSLIDEEYDYFIVKLIRHLIFKIGFSNKLLKDILEAKIYIEELTFNAIEEQLLACIIIRKPWDLSQENHDLISGTYQQRIINTIIRLLGTPQPLFKTKASEEGAIVKFCSPPFNILGKVLSFLSLEDMRVLAKKLYQERHDVAKAYLMKSPNTLVSLAMEGYKSDFTASDDESDDDDIDLGGGPAEENDFTASDDDFALDSDDDMDLGGGPAEESDIAFSGSHETHAMSSTIRYNAAQNDAGSKDSDDESDDDEATQATQERRDRIFQPLLEKIKTAKTKTEIDLSGYRIPHNELQKLAKALEQIQAPILLNISHTKIGDEGVNILAQTLEKTKIPIFLDLSHTKISNEGTVRLTQAINNAKTTVSITLHSNKRVSIENYDILAKALNDNRAKFAALYKDSGSKTDGDEDPEETREESSADDGDDKPDDNGGAVAQNEMANEQPTHQNSTSYFVETEVEFVELIETNATTIEPTKEEQEYLEAVEEALQRVEQNASPYLDIKELINESEYSTSKHELPTVALTGMELVSA